MGAVIIMVLGVLIRIIYILNTTVYERGHDVGAYTSLTDGIVNPGHLGYIEYLVKFNHLPDFDPFSLYSYYHPPLHHFLASLVVRASLALGATYDAAFENIQFLLVFYQLIILVLAYLIFKRFTSKESHILAPLSIIAFHPGLIYMCGSVNNDTLSLLFEVLVIYFALRWMENYNVRYLLLTGLSIGLGMCTKISVGIMALPVGLIMLGYLVKMLKEKRLLRCIREYILFAVVTLPVGLFFTVRNYILFNTKPGIASATPEDIKYMGQYSVIERLGIPKSLGLSYPFHNIYGSESSNVWLILFRTSVFGEMRPDVEGLSLIGCRIAFITSVILGIGLTLLALIMFIRLIFIKDGRAEGIFLLSGLLTVLLSYILFVLKYPYTCSCDFRYVALSLLYSGIGLSMAFKHE